MSAQERAAEVLRAEEQKILGYEDFERHRDSCVGEINGMRRALRLLADAGLLADEAHDREVAARALREAAEWLHAELPDPCCRVALQRLDERADRVEAGDA